MRRLALAWLLAAVCAGNAAAQTTSARAESIEITSRADELLEAGDYRRAAQRYRAAIEIDETNELAYIGLSATLDFLHRYEEALDVLRTAEAQLGWTPTIGLQRGIHLSRLERWEDAIASLARVLKANPRSFEASYYLGDANLAAEHWSGAVEAFDGYLASRPDSLSNRDAAVETRRAYALLNAGEAARATQGLDRALADDPEHLSARVLLVTALAKQGKCKRALAVYEDIEQISDTAPTLRYNAAVCQFRTGHARTALATLDGYGDSGAAPSRSLLLRARIQSSLGNAENAEQRYREAIAAGVPAEVELAGWLSDHGDHAGAVELLWPKVESTTDADVLAIAAQALVAEADYERAAAATTRLVELRPEAKSWTLHGKVLLAREQWTAAEQAYTRALEAEPNRREAAVGLRRALEHQATAAYRANDADAARKLLTRAVAADPDADAAAFNLAFVENDPARIVALLAPRVERLPSPNRARLLLGQAYGMTGDTDAAVRELETVVRSKRADAGLRRQALTALARATSHRSPDRALELIARARKLARGDAAANKRLDAVEASARVGAAERLLDRGSLAGLRPALRKIKADTLEPRARTRLKLLEVYETGHRKGLRAAIHALDAMTDDELASLAASGVSADSLRHSVALDLGARFIARSTDYRKLLRSHAKALAAVAKTSKPADRFLGKWYYRMLEWAVARSAGALARSLSSDAPASVQTPAFEHNAILAAATSRTGHKPFTRAQKTRLEQLAAAVPEALANLAMDADQRDDHAAALAYLKKIPIAQRTREIAEWIRWKELLYGAR